MDSPPSTHIPLSESTQHQFPTAPTPAQIRRRRFRLLWSYLPDWLLCICLTGALLALDYIDGFEREFDLTDTSIQHSFTPHERVPNAMVPVYAGAVPLVVLPIINIITVRSWWDLHNSILGLVLSLSLTGAVTQVVKVLVGRPRPDLIARCQPVLGAANSPVFGLVTSKICTQTDIWIMRDGFRSFLSGHTSLSFAGLGFLSFYLAGKLHLFDERGYTGKAWISLTPFIGAIVIAITRTMDYRHHPTDVISAAILGILFAIFAYRQYYPSLNSTLSHRPYSPRIPSLRVITPVPDVEHGRISSASGQHIDPVAFVPLRIVPQPGRVPYRQPTTSTTRPVPPAQLYTPLPGQSRSHEGHELYEMDPKIIGGTVNRPR